MFDMLALSKFAMDSVHTRVYTVTRQKPSGVKVFVTHSLKCPKKWFKELAPKASLELANHSPDGFEFGYCGSGPHQLALALLFNVTKNPVTALRHYDLFTREVLSTVPRNQVSWQTTGFDIVNWIADVEAGRDRKVSTFIPGEDDNQQEER